jgi:hypothetical protein
MGPRRRLQAVQIIGGALRMGGGGEYCPLVISQHREPQRDIGGMVFPNLRREAEVGAKERRAKLGNQFLAGVAFVACRLRPRSRARRLPCFVAWTASCANAEGQDSVQIPSRPSATRHVLLPFKLVGEY